MRLLRNTSNDVMLSKEKRLNLKYDFKWVAAGKSLDSKFAKLFFRMGENQTPRVGIATSLKNFKKAHDRNKARRLVSAAFAVLYPTLTTTINIVALPKQAIIGVKSKDVLLDLQQRLKDEKIID